MKHMKTPSPDQHTDRILRFTRQALTLPFTLATACCFWLFRRCRSPEQLRAADQQRQTRVRRELRGLPPDHVARPAKP